MTKDDIVRKAEEEVLASAKELAFQLSSSGRTLTAQEQRLRMAVFMLNKAKGLSGAYKINLPGDGSGGDGSG